MRETRTRILFLYGLLLLITVGFSIPIFRYVLFASVARRVRENLIEERADFLDAYHEWESAANQVKQALRNLVVRSFRQARLEDDNFQIILIDDQFYQSYPASLVIPLSPGSELFERLKAVDHYTID